MEIECPNCGITTPGPKFCHDCGQSLVQSKQLGRSQSPDDSPFAEASIEVSQRKEFSWGELVLDLIQLAVLIVGMSIGAVVLYELADPVFGSEVLNRFLDNVGFGSPIIAFIEALVLLVAYIAGGVVLSYRVSSKLGRLIVGERQGGPLHALGIRALASLAWRLVGWKGKAEESVPQLLERSLRIALGIGLALISLGVTWKLLVGVWHWASGPYKDPVLQLLVLPIMVIVAPVGLWLSLSLLVGGFIGFRR